MGMEEKNAADDLALLLEKIKKIDDGDFSYASPEEFSDPQIAEVVNGLLNSFMRRNNKFLVRINDAMTQIADNSCVKVMLDEIDSQEDSINTLKNVKQEFSSSITTTEESGNRVLALTKQVRNALDDYGLQCRKALDSIGGIINRRDIDSKTEAVLSETFENISYLDEGLSASTLRLKDMLAEMDSMFKALDMRAEKYSQLFSAIDSITQSFDDLFTDCISVGDHLYRISRNVDNVRNDMFRQNSWPFLHDKLKIFVVDHLTLTWRLYNHTIEYETLRIEQVNNPDGCKFGIWANSELEKDSEISKSKPFKDAMLAHYELHDHAVSCFLLKESFKNKEALAAFKAALETNKRFEKAMEELHKYLNSIGIYDETEFIRYA